MRSGKSLQEIDDLLLQQAMAISLQEAEVIEASVQSSKAHADQPTEQPTIQPVDEPNTENDTEDADKDDKNSDSPPTDATAE